MKIRLAKRDDCKHLPTIEKRAGMIFRTVEMDDIADGDPTSETEYAAICKNGLLWVAADEMDAPGAFLAGKILDGCAYIHEVSVDPAHQGKGLGKALIEAFCDWAAGRGYPIVTLSTFRSVPWNGPYYQRLGFEVVELPELGPDHEAVREQEIAGGLDATERIFMRKKP